MDVKHYHEQAVLCVHLTCTYDGARRDDQERVTLVPRGNQSLTKINLRMTQLQSRQTDGRVQWLMPHAACSHKMYTVITPKFYIFGPPKNK